MEKNIEKYSNDFITQIKNFDTICYNKTINMFQDLNDLIFIFYEKINKNINFIDTNDNKNTYNNVTKKININVNHKKTIRKQYKDLLN